jgi:hypothetical protein
MTTIIDYVVLNATFSSTTINLVNLDSSVFFPLDAALTCSHRTDYVLAIVIQLVQLIWSHGKIFYVHPYTEKCRRKEIYFLCQIWPQIWIGQRQIVTLTAWWFWRFYYFVNIINWVFFTAFGIYFGPVNLWLEIITKGYVQKVLLFNNYQFNCKSEKWNATHAVC